MSAKNQPALLHSNIKGQADFSLWGLFVSFFVSLCLYIFVLRFFGLFSHRPASAENQKAVSHVYTLYTPLDIYVEAKVVHVLPREAVCEHVGGGLKGYRFHGIGEGDGQGIRKRRSLFRRDGFRRIGRTSFLGDIDQIRTGVELIDTVRRAANL